MSIQLLSNFNNLSYGLYVESDVCVGVCEKNNFTTFNLYYMFFRERIEKFSNYT